MEAENVERCGWCGDDPLYCEYHDKEWGRLTHDDTKLFELLVLEGAQTGLSWLTVLRRREGYREAFHHFNVERVAQMNEQDVECLLQNPGIIRHRKKIEAAIKNARCFISVQQQFGNFYNYILSFLPQGKPIVNHPRRLEDVPVTSPVSDALAKDLKKRGFTFVGATICYAFLQAAGFVNDHLESCSFKNGNLYCHFCPEFSLSRCDRPH